MPKYFSLHTLKSTLLIWFVLLSIVPLSISSYVGYSMSKEELKTSAIHELTTTSVNTADFIKNWFHYRKTDISSWTKNRTTVEFLTTLETKMQKENSFLNEYINSDFYVEITEKYTEDLINLTNEYDYVYDLFLISKNGDILYTLAKEKDLGTNLINGNYSKTNLSKSFKKTLFDEKVHFSDLELYEPSKNLPAGFMTAPILLNGELIGVFAVQLKLNKIFDQFDKKDAIEGGFINYLVGEDSILKAGLKNSNKVLVDSIDLGLFKNSSLETINNVKVFHYEDPLGYDVIALKKEINILGVKWTLVSEAKTSIVYSQVDELKINAIFFVFLLFLVVITVSFVIARRVTKPLVDLTYASIGLADGRRESIKIDSRTKEIILLSENFNKMISNIHENEKELLIAKELAEQNEKSKAEFLASMSHEIRTPMNGVVGMVNLLKATKLDSTQLHYTELAQGSAEALLSIINDILDFSKIEAGKLELEDVEFNLRDELGNFAEANALKAQEKGVELILDVVDVKQSLIISDITRVRQMMTNLVSNAIKFTSEGHILIHVRLDEFKSDSAKLFVDVHDSGIGIPANKIGLLFESFSQVDGSTTRKYGGTGLGLSITKTLSEMMGGEVSVTSKVGEGSIFSFNIAVKVAKSSVNVTPSISVEDKQVLIVDSSTITTGILKAQFELWGMNVTSAISSEIALQKCNSDIDLVLIDLNMTEPTYEELVKELKSKFENIKFVIMGKLDSAINITHYNSIGFDHFFPKPITTKDLFSTLKILSDNSSIEKEQESKEDIIVWNEHSKILLVDDNMTNKLVADGILENFGLEDVDMAADGFEALDALKNSKNEYAIVLMDCQMPNMDGYEATQCIRKGDAGDRYKDIPVIAMTANAMEGDKQKCFISGMDDYISKPINLDQFKSVLIKWINR
ncbi:MAG: response regulator [Helicobacteraceae bacterium]|nr:response regulator [Helicobacteraceae bacterium]